MGPWGPRGGPMGSQGGDPWDPRVGAHGIPGWALGDPLALGDPWAPGDPYEYMLGKLSSPMVHG